MGLNGIKVSWKKKKNWRRKIEDKDLNFPIERLFMNIFFLWKSVLYTVIYLLEKKRGKITKIHE